MRIRSFDQPSVLAELEYDKDDAEQDSDSTDRIEDLNNVS